MLISLLRTYLYPYRRPLIAVTILSLIGTMAALFLPSLNAAIIDQGVATGDTDYIWRTGGIMLVVSLLQIVSTIIATYLGAKVAMSFGRDVRATIFERVLSFSARELNHFGAPSLITRNTNDVQQVQMLVLLLATMFLSAPITMVGGVIMAVREDLGLSWLVAVAMPVLAISILLVVRKMRPLFRLMQTRIDTVNRVLREQITGIRVVRAFVREPYESARFATANGELTATATSVGRLMASLFPIVMVILNISSVAVLWFGARRVDAGEMQIGSLTAFSVVPDPDPVLGHDGDLPADDRPPRRSVRGADRRGAGHRVVGTPAGPAGHRPAAAIDGELRPHRVHLSRGGGAGPS